MIEMTITTSTIDMIIDVAIVVVEIDPEARIMNTSMKSMREEVVAVQSPQVAMAMEVED